MERGWKDRTKLHSMTKEQLEALKQDIKELNRLYDKLANLKYSKEIVSDVVKDYRWGRPTNLSITGIGSSEYPRLRQKQYETQRRVVSAMDEMENWLDTIDDPEIRTILRLQYIELYTLEKIAEYMGYEVKTITRKLKAFWFNQNTLQE